MKSSRDSARTAWLGRAVRYVEAFGRMRFSVPREGPPKGSWYRQPRVDRLLRGAQRIDDPLEPHLYELPGDKLAMTVIPVLISVVVHFPEKSCGESGVPGVSDDSLRVMDWLDRNADMWGAHMDEEGWRLTQEAVEMLGLRERCSGLFESS